MCIRDRLSISQLCDKGYKIVFEKDACLIYDTNMKDILFKGFRNNNIYELSITCISSNDNLCLLASNNDYFLWHKRFGHLNMKTISKISKFDLVKGLPKIAFKKDFLSIRKIS